MGIVSQFERRNTRKIGSWFQSGHQVKNLVICKVQDLSYSIGQKVILKNLNFDLSLGKAVVLRGDNGAGKSTLLKILLNSKNFTQSVIINSEPTEISYLGHDLGLYTSLSLAENLNIFHSLAINPLDWKTVQEWVEKFRLHLRWDDPIYLFSRGMKQKAGFLRAILSQPKILLLDEPFTGLDEHSVSLVYELIQSIKSRTAILSVIHGFQDLDWDGEFLLRNGSFK
jgi:heme exporter protein A